MLNVKDKIKFFFIKNEDCEEIFSTSEKRRNVENTNPLDLQDDITDVILSGYRPINFDVTGEGGKRSNNANCDISAKKIAKGSLKTTLVTLFLVAFFLMSASVDVVYRFYPFIFNFSNINKNHLYLYFQGAVNIIFLIYAIIFFVRELKLTKNFLFTNSTAALLTGLFSLVQCLALLLDEHTISSANINAYVSIFALYMVMVSFNNLFIKKRTKRNLKFCNSKKTKYVSGMYEKENIDNQANYKIAYRKEKGNINDFFDTSFTPSNLKKAVFFLNAFSVFIAMVIAVFGVTTSKNLTYIFSALTVTFLMLNPIIFISCINFHMNGICKKALRKGAMISSLYACQCFFKTNAVAVDASDLYPTDNVVLRSIKTFKGQRIDEAILRAAAVICAIGGPLSKVFDKVIMGKKNMLSNPTEVLYEDEMGVVGFIDSQRVLLGNRELLKKYKIDPPSRDYEKKYIAPEMEHIYLAMGKELVAMFVLEYLPNKSLKRCINNLERNGITLLVKTADCNVTAEKISRDFDISENGVRVLKFKTSEQINKIENIKNEIPPALLCTFERLSAFIWALCFSKKVFFRKNIIVMMMTLALILGCVFSVTLALTGGIDVIKPIELGVYYVFWVFMAILMPKFSL